jgi:hypothetical protein
VLSFCCVALSAQQLYSQSEDSVLSELSVNLELRPRAEYRYNYKYPPTDTAAEYFNVVQRNRLSILYARRKWLLKSDFQEIHVWDDKHPASKVGSVNFYQLFLETKFKHLNVRLGRQSVLLDNGRIFSDAPWAQQGRSHEGIRLMARSEKFQQDAFLLFTRKYGTQFDATYSPVAAHRYKYLFIHHISFNSGKAFSFNAVNAVDIFDNPNAENTFVRFTAGGRLELKNSRWYATLNGYFQLGKTPQGKRLTAYYLQPEVRLTYKKSTWRLGAEILSGTNPQSATNKSGDFDVLYGVAWKFMGNMNLFTRFPADVGGKGLLNPYVFVTLALDRKLSIRTDLHTFYTMFYLKNRGGENARKCLGFENDLSIKYFPVKNMEINYGFSFMKTTSAMALLPKIIDANKIAVWSYLMVSYTFNALHLTKAIK